MTEHTLDEWKHRLKLAGTAFGALVLVSLVISVLVLANAYFALDRQQDLQSCRAVYSTPLSNARDLRNKDEFAGLHFFAKNDQAGVDQATSKQPSIERTITRLQTANDHAVSESLHDPDRFLAECHAAKGGQTS